ncbi:MAG TPA: SbcC/MukB-like Walker B domain-containing protein [Clostridiales bacterium]|nr:SbcC/MukB-like Walker B domain-containing protein [Clostridiales bacterium]HOL92028.1 SbcC/MukB-like Walker B domain-containing protein [Clostridiales bacterium]HPP34898.1 SbcC/MukB-like Walker B domain-containing protein [Clostridiales bacterium]
MKLLKKLLLIHWHFFSHELIEFDRINFLTGKNASGKTTLIDALQLLLLGDANGRNFFNKAANERSSRSLKGYLRCELGDDGGTGFRYLREGRFTSYIACEFYDDQKKSSFTAGVVFDCYEDGTDEHHFFILDSELPENHFIVDGVPMTYKDLRTFVNKNYKRGKFDFPASDRSFQDILKGKFGGLKNKYFSLLKKAVSFTPITDIETFITEYVCDVKSPVDISLMQDNIRSYKRLEFEADIMEERVRRLSEISEKYGSYLEESQRFEIQSYIIDRAKLQVSLDKIDHLGREIAGLDSSIAEEKNRLTGINLELEEEKKKRDGLLEDKHRSDINNKLEQLRKQKNDLIKEVGRLEGNVDEIIQRLRRYALEWRKAANKCEPLREMPDCDLKMQFSNELEVIAEYSEKTAGYAKHLIDIDAQTVDVIMNEDFGTISDDLGRFKESAQVLRASVGKKRNEYIKELDRKEMTLRELEKGIKDYDPKLILLRDEIKRELSMKYGKDIHVHILSDLLEVRDERWRNAIEAYLHTQKFYLIIEPRYFVDALKIYDRLKFSMGFYDWGIVDTGKLEEKQPVCEKGSLAEEVITADHYARLFVDFVMGRVIKCDTVEELRNHDRAITDTCMLYQGYVARQLHPDRWKHPYIGRNAVEKQIEGVKQAIGLIMTEISACDICTQAVGAAADMGVASSNEAESYIKTIQEAAVLPTLRARLAEVIEEEGKIDISWLIGIDKKIEESEKRIKNLEQQKEECVSNIARYEGEKQDIASNRIPQEQNNAAESRKAIDDRYDSQWISSTGEPRFMKELGMRSSAREVADNFSSQLERTRSQKAKKRDDLETARAEYNKVYQAPHDIKREDNAAYDKELEELQGIKLPEYRKKIHDAKEKAFQQFQDDFLAKLKSNIDMVRNQIDELNSALKESVWGTERYRFTMAPRQEYVRYYNMITDEMLLEGYNIASQIFRDKHRDAIDELFRQIIDVESELNADARAELEKNIKRFTDYRTYLQFDLEVTDTEGRTQRLSKTLRKKSGGETQTPFYIAVLASFAQLYRIQDPSFNRIRLIMFDEAFSKMDSERIQESIRLLRRFGFQCILSAPSEKVGDIAPLVDRNLCVIRNGNTAAVRAFDARKLIDESAGEYIAAASEQDQAGGRYGL